MVDKTMAKRQRQFMEELKESGGKRITIVLEKPDVDNLALIMAIDNRPQTNAIRDCLQRRADQIRDATK